MNNSGMLTRMSDFALKELYNIDPILLRRIYEISEILNPIYADALDVTLSCIKSLVMQYAKSATIKSGYLYDHGIQLLAEDLGYRITLALQNNNKKSLDDFISGKLSLSDLGRAMDSHKITNKQYQCMSCGGDAEYDQLNKKFNCKICDASYADLDF